MVTARPELDADHEHNSAHSFACYLRTMDTSAGCASSTGGRNSAFLQAGLAKVRHKRRPPPDYDGTISGVHADPSARFGIATKWSTGLSPQIHTARAIASDPFRKWLGENRSQAMAW